MAVTRTGSVLDIHSAAITATQELTVPSDATLAIVAVGGYTSGLYPLTEYHDLHVRSLTLNGVEFSLARTDDDSVYPECTAIFYLLNPSVGTQNLSWYWETEYAASEGFHIFVAFCKGNHAIRPIRSCGGYRSESPDLTTSTGLMDATSGDLAFAVSSCYEWSGNPVTMNWTGATKISGDHYNENIAEFAEASPSAPITIISDVNVNLSDMSISGCVIAAAASEPSGVQRTGWVRPVRDDAHNSSYTPVVVPSDATLAIAGVAGFSATDHYFTNGSLKLNNVAFDVARIDDGSENAEYSAIFYLKNPSIGVQSLAWDWSGTSYPAEGVVINLAFYKGNDPTNPIKSSGGEYIENGFEHSATTGSMDAAGGDLAIAIGSAYHDRRYPEEEWAEITWENAANLCISDHHHEIVSYAEAYPTAAITISADSGPVSWGPMVISGVVIAAASGGTDHIQGWLAVGGS